MVDTKKLKMRDTPEAIEFTIKTKLALQTRHEIDELLQDSKGYEAQKVILKKAVINPKIDDKTFDSDETDGEELGDLADILMFFYHIIPEFSKEDYDMMKGMNEKEKEIFKQDFLMRRVDDLKKKPRWL